jgi:4-hydroxyproline epimerase
MKRLRIIDSHTGGEPTRLVLGGICGDELEDWRRAILCEPRGHEVLVGALLEDASAAGCLAKVSFFNNVGMLGMCGHGMMGVVESLRHLGRIGAGAHRIETPVGEVIVRLWEDGRATVRNVLSYRLAKDVEAGGVKGDVVWGGNWFFLVADHGLELEIDMVPELTRASLEIRHAVREAGYPEVDHIELCGGAKDPANDGRGFVLCPGGEWDRSPCGTGTSAKLACLAGDGELAAGELWRQESVIGSVFEGSYEEAEGGVVASITGRAYVMGEGELLFDPEDPFRWGIGACQGGAGELA